MELKTYMFVMLAYRNTISCYGDQTLKRSLAANSPKWKKKERKVQPWPTNKHFIFYLFYRLSRAIIFALSDEGEEGEEREDEGEEGKEKRGGEEEQGGD